MKKIKVLLSILAVGIFLVGCSALDGGSSISNEEKYDALNSLVNSPNVAFETYANKLPSKFSFSVYTLGAKEEWDLEGETQVIVPAMISRNTEKYLLISVDNLADYDYPEGSYLTITGSLAGSIYWTEENKQVDVLHVEASKVEVLEPSEGEPIEDLSFDVETVYSHTNFTFLSAEPTVAMNRPAAYLYFDFENKGESEISPASAGLTYYQGDTILERTIMPGNTSPAEDALNTDGFNKTAPTKTSKYYWTLEAKYSDEEMNDTDPIMVYKYDDDFNTVQIGVIELAK